MPQLAKQKDLQIDASAMEYSKGGKTWLISQKSHHLFIFDINKRYRLKGEKRTAFDF